MHKTIPVLVMLLMIFSGLANAMVPHDIRSPTTNMVKRAVEPMDWNNSDSGQYDAVSSDISVTPDLVIHNISANAKVTVKVLRNSNSFNFTLMNALKVTSVSAVGNTVKAFKLNTTLNNLLVNLTTTATPGQTVTLNVNYYGNVSKSLSGDDNCNLTAGLLLKRSTPWFPMPLFDYTLAGRIRPTDLDRQNVTVHVLIPKNWIVVSVGKNVSAVAQGQNMNVTYKSLNEVAGFTVAAAGYSVNTTVHNGVTLTTYLFSANATRSGKYMSRAISVLDWMTTIYGAFPYTTFNMVEVNKKLGGIESDQAMIIADTFGVSNIPLSFVVTMADQYFLFATCPIDNYDAWLSASMSEYAAVYFQIAVDGKRDELNNLHLFYGSGTGEMAIRDIQTDHPRYINVIYDKGTYILHMLRYLVGNATFTSIMQAYLSAGKNKNVTLDTFLAAVKQSTATDLRWFFDEWLNTTAVLEYALNTAPAMLYKEGNQMRIDFTVKKMGIASMPGDIGLSYYTGKPVTVLSKLMCQSCGSKTFSVNITEDVSSVFFDPDQWLLSVNNNNENSTIPVKEDVRVESIALSPNTGVVEGDTVTVSTVVKNVGDDAQTFSVSFLDNGTKFSTKQVSSLASGAKTTLSADWKATKGLRNISSFADSDQVNKEYNKTNNKANVTIRVAEYIPPPDLKFLGAINISKSKISENDYVNFTVKVFNDYRMSLAGVHLDFDIDGTLLSTKSLPLMAPNGTANATVEWQAKGGTHQVKFVLHAPVGVAESNTDNNIIQTSLTVNDIPVARIDVDNGNPFSGVEIEFNGAGSTDANGIASYKFDFGDGQGKDWGESPTATHKYKFPGEYKATVTVKDNWGIVSLTSDPMTIIVRDVAPTVDFDVSPDTGTVNTNFTFTANAKDSDGTIVKYNWDFGDSKTSNDANPAHMFTKAQTFTISLYVTDNGGLVSTTISKSVTIKNLKPTAAGTVTPTTVNANDPVSLDASKSTDPEQGDLKYSWTANGVLRSSKMRDTITFPAAGNYDITLTVTDLAGATSTASFSVKVNPGPPCTDCGTTPTSNNNLLYGAAAGGVAILVVILGLIFFMRSKKAKAAQAKGPETKPKPTVKGKGAKPEAKGTKPTPKPKDEAEEKEVKPTVEETPKKPPEVPKPEATKPETPKPEAPVPKPKVVKKPAPKPAAPKSEEKPPGVVNKAKKAAEDEWEK